MNTITVLLVSVATMLTSCASDSALRREIAIGNIKIAAEKAQRRPVPLVDVSAPLPGCTPVGLEDMRTTLMKLETGAVTFDQALAVMDLARSQCTMVIRVSNPIPEAPGTVAIPDDPTARVWEKVIDQTGTLLNIAAGGASAVAITKAVGSGINQAIRAQPAPVAPVVLEQERVEVVRPEIVQTPAAQVVNPVVIQPQPAQVIQVPTQIVYPQVITP